MERERELELAGRFSGGVRVCLAGRFGGGVGVCLAGRFGGGSRIFARRFATIVCSGCMYVYICFCFEKVWDARRC